MADPLDNAWDGPVKKIKRRIVVDPGFHTEYTGDLFCESEFEKPDYIVDDLLIRQCLTNISGPAGGGKTTISLSIAVQNVTGEVLGKPCIPFRTLLIDEENGAVATGLVFRKAIEGAKEFYTEEQLKFTKENFSCFCMEGFKFNSKWALRLGDILETKKENGTLPDLLIIDNVSRTFDGDSFKSEDARMVHTILKPIAIKYNMAVLLLSHTRKGDPKELQDISGSGDFGAQVTIAYITKKVSGKRIGEKQEVTLWFKKVKNNMGFPEDPPRNLVITSNDNYFVMGETGLVSQNMAAIKESVIFKCKGAIKEWCVNNPRGDYTTGDIMDQLTPLGYRKNAINSAINELADKEEWFERIKKGQYKIRGRVEHHE